jgi:membrane associated rhomboid family serine protease
MSYYDRDYYRPTGFGGFSFFPPIIKQLLIINIVVFILQQMMNNIAFGEIPGWYLLNHYFALNPLVGFDRFGESNNFQIWQLFTYQFMHGGFSHIFYNMLMLWMFGMEIENIWGSKKFLIFYLTSGVGAGLVQILLAPIFENSLAPVIGASGSVFGVMLAFAMLFPNRYIFLYFLVPLKAKYLIGFLFIVELLSVGGLSMVAHLAHIGGAVTGAIFVLLDKNFHFNFENLKFFSIPKKTKKRPQNNFRKPFSAKKDNIQDAEFYDINSLSKQAEQEISQSTIDAILDKISQSGYKNLTEEEKRILFEASKKK